MKNKRSPFVTTVGSIFLGANLSLCLKAEEPPTEKKSTSDNNVEEMRTGNPPLDKIHENNLEKPTEEPVAEPAKDPSPHKGLKVNPPAPDKK